MLPGARVLSSLLYIVGIGVLITVSLAVSIWGLSKISVEREYFTLQERAQFAATYGRISSPEKRLEFAKTQLGLKRPLVALSTSLASECQKYFSDFELYVGKAGDILVKHNVDPLISDVSTLPEMDLARLEVYTQTAIELITRYDACSNP